MALVYQKFLASNIVETDDKKFISASQLSTLSTALQAGNNLSDLKDASSARTNLGLGSAAVLNSGTSAGNVPVLDSNGKISSDLLPAAAVGALEYQGTYDASSGNAPSNPTKGYYWVISTAGTINSVAYAVGDWMVYNGNSFDKIDNQTVVSSVAGKKGAVTLVLADLTDVKATATEVNYLSGVTSKVQDQLNAKFNTADINTDSALGGANASDTVVSSQKAIKSYVDSKSGSFVSTSATSDAITVSGSTATLSEAAKGITLVYVDQEGILVGGATVSGTTVTFADNSLDGKKVYITYLK
jgi:hypothetical protein